MLFSPLIAAISCCLVGGIVQTTSGTPLASATVRAGGASATTDAAGRFSLTLAPGTYALSVEERGFTPVTITVVADAARNVRVALEPLDSPELRRIGEVTVDGRLAPIRGTLPSVTLSRAGFDELGEDRIVQGLASLPGATFARPDGGAASGITVVALRGPDPSESLLTLDGQLLNDGNTGDLDLSRLPVSAFSAVAVTEGLGPEDSNGSNTFGGAIDLISLRPTSLPKVAASYSLGSFGTSEAWLNATGTSSRFGYALALDDQQEAGYVDRVVPLYSTVDPACAPCATRLASGVGSHLLSATATWSFASHSDVQARIFTLGDVRDQSSALNGIDDNAADAGTPQYGAFAGPGNQTFGQTIRAYQLRGRLPLGAGELVSELSASDNSVTVAGGSASPYDLTHRDRRYDGGLTWQRDVAGGEFALGASTRYEELTFAGPPSATATPLTAFEALPVLGQTVDTAFVRGGFMPAPRLRLDAGAFISHYTTFGSNLDGRFGAIYDVARDTDLRFSLGTGFRPPLLIERYRFPLDQLGIDGNNVFVGQGSPDEHPEHATEYELGASHTFANATLEASFYRTNLRDPIEIYYPLAAVASGACANNGYAAPLAHCVSYQSNVGNAVYQGVELRLAQRIPALHLFVNANYGLNVAYPFDLTSDFSNPTSGGNLVDNAQFPGIPQQQGSLETTYRNAGWHAATRAVFRGNNNELGQPPFATLAASFGRSFGGADLSLAAENLTNAVSGPFTHFGGGVPYRGLTGPGTYGPLPTDALFVEPLGIRAILTVHP